MDFCDILKMVRKNRKLTQEDLAEKMMLTQSIISGWENGNQLPQFENLLKLSNILNISLDELMGRTENYEIIRSYKIEQLKQHGALSLSDLRKDENESVDNLAQFLGIARNTLISWEKNGLPNIDKYKMIVEHFGLSLEDFKELK